MYQYVYSVAGRDLQLLFSKPQAIMSWVTCVCVEALNIHQTKATHNAHVLTSKSMRYRWH